MEWRSLGAGVKHERMGLTQTPAGPLGRVGLSLE